MIHCNVFTNGIRRRNTIRVLFNDIYCIALIKIMNLFPINVIFLSCLFVHLSLSSSPVFSKIATSDLNSSLFDDMKPAHEDKREVDEDQKVKDGEKTKEEEEMDSDSDCLEWELRNTDSVFSELSELSREYVENVDQGASVRGTIMCFI